MANEHSESEILKELRELLKSYNCFDNEVDKAVVDITGEINSLLELHNQLNPHLAPGSGSDLGDKGSEAYKLNESIKEKTSLLIEKIETLEGSLQEQKAVKLFNFVKTGKNWLDFKNKHHS